MRILLGFFSLAMYAAPPFQASFDASAKWQAAQGLATPDPQIQHDKRTSLRVEASAQSDAFIRRRR